MHFLIHLHIYTQINFILLKGKGKFPTASTGLAILLLVFKIE